MGWLWVFLLLSGMGLFMTGMFIVRVEAVNKRTGHKVNVKRNRRGILLAITGAALTLVFILHLLLQQG